MRGDSSSLGNGDLVAVELSLGKLAKEPYRSQRMGGAISGIIGRDLGGSLSCRMSSGSQTREDVRYQLIEQALISQGEYRCSRPVGGYLT